MSIPSKQIGWSQESNLLWNISKQLERLTGVTGSLSIQPSVEFYSSLSIFPVTGTSGVIYVAEDTEIIYRWDGAAYVELSSASVTPPAANIYTYTGSPVINPYFACGIQSNYYFSILNTVYGPYNLYSTINLRDNSETYVTSLVWNYEAITSVNVNQLYMPLLTSASYPNLIVVSTNSITVTSSILTTLSLPSLLFCDSTVSISAGIALTNLNLNSLKSINGNISISGTGLTNISLPQLLNCSIVTIGSNILLTNISFPLLTSCISITTSGTQNALTTISLPSIEYISRTTIFAVDIRNCTSLTNFSFGSNLKLVGSNVTFTGNALNQASIDNILIRLAALDGTGGTISYNSKTVSLNGGTNSTPSAAGLAAKAILVGRGCTVTNN